MKEAILILGAAGIFLFGYVFMGRLDSFLDENRKTIESESEKAQPVCMLLTKDMSDEELTQEIRAFRSQHENVQIMLSSHAGKPAKNTGCFGQKT